MDGMVILHFGIYTLCKHTARVARNYGCETPHKPPDTAVDRYVVNELDRALKLKTQYAMSMTSDLGRQTIRLAREGVPGFSLMNPLLLALALSSEPVTHQSTNIHGYFEISSRKSLFR
jgi:hypothetical protein